MRSLDEYNASICVSALKIRTKKKPPAFTVSHRVMLALTLVLLPSVAAAQSPTDFQNAMRKLWTDRVIWTRSLIVGAAAELPDKEVTSQRLGQNQTDIGNAFAAYYGQETGGKLTALLKSNALIATDLVSAMKAGDAETADSLRKSWRANGEEITNFLHAANTKYWAVATLRTVMHTHLDQTYLEATHRLRGDYAADVRDFDAIEHHVLAMADILSNGIMAQFPEKFGGRKARTARAHP